MKKKVLYILILFSNSFFAQNPKKIFQNIQNHNITEAYNEFKSFSEKKNYNTKKKALILTAKCILQTEPSLEIYSPYKSKILYDSIYKLGNSSLDKNEIDLFLQKYNLKRTDIVDKIESSIFNVVIQTNSLDEYNKTILLLSNPYKSKLIKLHEELLFRTINNNKSIDSIRMFINLYPSSQFKKDAENLLESTLFFRLKSSPNIDSLNSFITKYNSSVFLPIITDIRDSIALPKSNSYQSILKYIQQYPNSKFSHNLEEKLSSVYFAEIKKNKRIKDCIDFTHKYPNFIEINKVKSILEKAYADSLIEFFTDDGFKEFKSFFPNSNKIHEINNALLNRPSKLIKERYLLNDLTDLNYISQRGFFYDITSDEYGEYVNNAKEIKNKLKKSIFKMINNNLYYLSNTDFNVYNIHEQNLSFYESFFSIDDNYINKSSSNSLFTKINYYYYFDNLTNSIGKIKIDTVEINDSIKVITPIFKYDFFTKSKILFKEKDDKLLEYSYRPPYNVQDKFNYRFEINNLDNILLAANKVYRKSDFDLQSLNLTKINELNGNIILNKIYDLEDLLDIQYIKGYNSIKFNILDLNALNNGEYILRLKFDALWYQNYSDNRYYSDDFISNTFQLPKVSSNTYLIKFNKDLKIISKTFISNTISKIISRKNGGFYTLDDSGVKISFYDNNLVHKWSKLLSDQDEYFNLYEFNNKIYLIGSSKNTYRLDGDTPIIWILNSDGKILEKKVIKLNIDSYVQSILEYNKELYYILRNENGTSMHKLTKKNDMYIDTNGG